MREAVTRIYYFANDLAPLAPDALPLLFAVKLRATGQSTRLVTTCCHSVLAVDHPYYEGNVVSAYPEACDLAAPSIAPLCRIFTTGWDSAHDGEMPSATASLEDSKATSEKFAKIVKHPLRETKGIRLQDVFAQLPPPVILGLAERARLLPPASAK